MDEEFEENYSTKVIYGHKIEHYADNKFLYDEFQPLDIRKDTILDKIERLFLTTLFFITLIGVVFIIHCL